MKILRLSAIAILLLTGTLMWNTFRFQTRQLKEAGKVGELSVSDSVVARLQQAIRWRTVSYPDTALVDTTQFHGFIDFLGKSFPKTHSLLQMETVNGYGLLFRWSGSNPELLPILLMGHYDVVPVIQGTESMWKKPPFSAIEEDGFVYGRGTLDDKSTVLGVLEAVEHLLSKGYRPKRTVYLSFGHDEEVTGQRGARAIVDRLAGQGIRLESVLDEGGVIKIDGAAGIEKPIALVGIAEKGYLTLELSTATEGGHSSMPPKETSIGELSRAVSKLEENQFPFTLNGTVGTMLDYLGPEMSFSKKMVMANRWLFSPVIKKILGGSNSGAASIHTTIAPTMLEAGVKDNVLAIDARAVINFRILPGETVASTIEHVKNTVGPKVKLKMLGTGNEPSPVSSPDAPPFQILHESIQSCYPEVIVSPYLVMAATDSRYFYRICDNVYRFSPMKMNEDDLKRPHGTNERISVGSYKQMIRFYVNLIEKSAGR